MTPDYYDSSEAAPARRPRPLRNAFLIALVAFVIGAALVTWALTRWEPARRLIVPAPVEAVPQALTTAAPTVTPGPVIAAPPPTVSPEATAITESRVAGLEARLSQIDAQASMASANAARAEGLLIAFAVRRTIDRGAALGYLEGQLRARFGDIQPRAVAAVISAAQAPVTLDMLRQRLDAIAPTLVGGGKNESWWDSATRAMGSLIVVRRADTPSPAADERVMRARMALNAGQADGALAEIARLPAHTTADEWMTMARRYIEAHRALDILEASALTTGSPTPQAAPQPTAQPETTGKTS